MTKQWTAHIIDGDGNTVEEIDFKGSDDAANTTREELRADFEPGSSNSVRITERPA